MVNTIYDNITNTSNKLDDETLKFLKKKYLEFELDENVFKKFVKDVVLFKPTHRSTPTPPNSASLSKTANFKVVNTLEKFAFDAEKSTTSADATSTPSTSTISTGTVSTASSSNNSVNPSKLTINTVVSSGVNTSKVIESVKQQAKCQFDKNAIDNKNRNNNETSLSSSINQRNRDELKNICERNSAFSKFNDDQLVLLPGQEWSVPYKRPPVCLGGTPNFQPLMTQTALLGTLIGDAHGK
jgi:hypothetical protein